MNFIFAYFGVYKQAVGINSNNNGSHRDFKSLTENNHFLMLCCATFSSHDFVLASYLYFISLNFRLLQFNDTNVNSHLITRILFANSALSFTQNSRRFYDLCQRIWKSLPIIRQWAWCIHFVEFYLECLIKFTQLYFRFAHTHARTQKRVDKKENIRLLSLYDIFKGLLTFRWLVGWHPAPDT